MVTSSRSWSLTGSSPGVARTTICRWWPNKSVLAVESFSEQFRPHLESTKLLRAGVEQGRFQADLDVDRVMDAFVGAIYFRLLMGSSLDPAWAQTLAETLLNGCLSRTPA